MAEWVETIFSTEVLAIAVPSVIFAITVVLMVKRLVNFVFSLVLLSFALVSGLAIVNHQVVGDYLRGKYSNDEVTKWKTDVTAQVQKVWDSVKELKDQLIQDKAEKEKAESVVGKTQAKLGEIQERIQRLEGLVTQTAVSDNSEEDSTAETDTDEPAEEIEFSSNNEKPSAQPKDPQVDEI